VGIDTVKYCMDDTKQVDRVERVVPLDIVDPWDIKSLWVGYDQWVQP